MSAGELEIAGIRIAPGERARIDVPLGRHVTGGELALPVQVVRGREDGPRLFVCAAVHGDEINGVEIIRRLLRRKLAKLRGALIAVPVVNPWGFIELSRYLPDRRDLNRSFPGSPRGSLAARLAHTFVSEIVEQSTHGIDLHTGAVHRSNLPQIRACLDDPETLRLARSFGVPVLINSNLRDGSLRQEGADRRIPMLLYEGGEALRFDERAIRAGVRGVGAVMAAIGMLPPSSRVPTRAEPYVARSSHWLRAPESGILRARVGLGTPVERGQTVGLISDPLGAEQVAVSATHEGVVIGRTELPLVNEGDALFHIATFADPTEASASVEDFQAELRAVGPEPIG